MNEKSVKGRLRIKSKRLMSVHEQQVSNGESISSKRCEMNKERGREREREIILCGRSKVNERKRQASGQSTARSDGKKYNRHKSKCPILAENGRAVIRTKRDTVTAKRSCSNKQFKSQLEPEEVGGW
jgi:predicted nucleic acid-binding Zn ribbon protein